MDAISTVRTVVEIISKIRDYAELVSVNKHSCRKLSERLDYFGRILMRPELAAKLETGTLVQHIKSFVMEARDFMQRLVPRSSTHRQQKRSIVLRMKEGAAVIGKFTLDFATSKRNAETIAEFHHQLDQYINDLKAILEIDNLITAKPIDFMQAACADLRNDLVKNMNTILMQVSNGQAMPDDIDNLSDCVVDVAKAIEDLADQTGVSKADIPNIAKLADREQLKTFVTKKVAEIRSISQMMYGKVVDDALSFPSDEDLSSKFESCGGANDDRLGAIGGFGVTYKRRYKTNGKIYALKEINVMFARSRGLDEDHMLAEAENLQKITHPNVVRCHHSFFSEDGLRFHLVMELVDGQTLEQILRTPRYQADPEKLVKWLKQMSSALVYMHEDCNIIHRDLKPANVMVTRGMEDIKLIDFGMAKVIGSDETSKAAMTSGVGTQSYMSWAKKHGEHYDGRDDVWAVGCITLEMLLGLPLTGQKALCDDDAKRAALLQEAVKRHPGLGELLKLLLDKKDLDNLPQATELLILADRVIVGDGLFFTKSLDAMQFAPLINATASTSQGGGSSGGVSPATSGYLEPTTVKEPTQSSSAAAGKKDAMMTALVEWFANIQVFTEENANEYAIKCIAEGLNTVELLAEELQEQKKAGTADAFLSTVSSRPVHRRYLLQALEKVVLPSTSSGSTKLSRRIAASASSDSIVPGSSSQASPTTLTAPVFPSISNAAPTTNTAPAAEPTTPVFFPTILATTPVGASGNPQATPIPILPRTSSAPSLMLVPIEVAFGKLDKSLYGDANATRWLQQSASNPEIREDSRMVIKACLMYLLASGAGALPRDRDAAVALSADIFPYLKKAVDEQDKNNIEYGYYVLMLGICYSFGLGVPVDEAEGLKLYISAANHGNNKHGQLFVASCYHHGRGTEKSSVQAAQWYALAAQQNHFTAQYKLGCCYNTGDGVPQNQFTAVEWFMKAAEQGHAGAQNNLANAYCNGQGIPQNFPQAVEWYRRAAEQGHVVAQYNLGNRYYKGQGVRPDYGLAVTWFLKAANQNFANAQNMLAVCCAHGHGCPLDYVKAFEWYSKAAMLGDADGLCNLGNAYYNGLGVKKDDAKAVELYTKAANQGHVGAQKYLAYCLANGQGIAKDATKAFEWWKTAADLGDADAQYNVGMCYKSGLGVKKDRSTANKWFEKAGAAGHEAAKKARNSLF